MVAKERKLRRSEVAARLGVSIPWVYELEKQGRLRAERTETGKVLYPEGEVERLKGEYAPDPRAKRRTTRPGKEKELGGRTSAKVFACFRAGMTDVGPIVEKTLVAPDVVRRLWLEWKKPLGKEGE